MSDPGQAGPSRSGISGSAPQLKKKRPKRLLIAGLAAIGLVIGLPALAVLSLLVAMMFGPVDVTPALRPFLPLAVINGPKGAPPRGRLDIARARLCWTGLRDGFGSPVLLELDDVRILDSAGHVADRIASGAIALDAFPLLHGAIAVTDLRISGAGILLRRNAGGAIDLDLPGPASSAGGGLAVDPSKLHRVLLSNTHITLADDQLHARWTVDPLEADLTPVAVKHRHGLSGTLTVGVSEVPDQGDATHPFQAKLTAKGALAPDNTLAWHIALDPVTPAGLASVLPGLDAVRAPVGLDADVILRAGPVRHYMMPADVSAMLSLGEGQIKAAGSWLFTQHGTAALHLTPGDRKAGSWPVRLTIGNVAIQLREPPVLPAAPPVASAPPVVVTQPASPPSSATAAPEIFPPPQFTASGEFEWKNIGVPRKVTGTASVALSDMPFTKLGTWWPAAAAKGARLWVTKNITAGTVRNLHITLGIGPDRTGQSADVTSVSGGLDGQAMELHWLRPIIPMEGLDAHLEFVDPRTIKIGFQNGYQPTIRTGHNVGATGTGKLILKPGSMIISDLDKKDQIGTIHVELAGDLRDQLALLAEPRLHVLSRHPIPFTHPRGNALIGFTLQLPLRAHVSTDDMTLDGHAHLTRLHLGDVAMGRAVDDGTLDTDVTMHGMTLAGHVLFSHIPADVKADTTFDDVPSGGTVDHVLAHLHLTPENVEAAGIPVSSYFYNRAEIAVNYTMIKDLPDTVALDLNMLNAGIHLPVWSKAPSVPASAHAVLYVDDGKLQSVEEIRASGPDLKLNGEAKFHPNGPPELLLPNFRISRSVGSARLTIPFSNSGPIAVHVRASTLDLTPLVQGKPKDTGSTPTTFHVPEAASGRIKGPPGRSWLIDVDADTLWYGKDSALGGVRAHIDHNGTRIERLRFAMTTPTPATVNIEPAGNTRRFTADVPDFGMLLDKLRVTDLMSGGHAKLDGRFDDTRASAPFKGTLNVTPFVITRAPEALRIARNLSIYGWLNTKNESKFEVLRFEMPVSFADGILHIHDGRAGNGALGATLEGPVNLDAGTLDLSGTIVPAFAVNALPGGLPAIGRLFAPEKGGGFLAVKFGLKGKLDDPAFSVSPFSIFLPGVLRKIF
ncbi:AsmA-like C-terminal region-containing protein [Acetobacter oeni]|uniref:Uncharacterized protein n=1 Tax=Acetobacter oeni TaxID=304077 RepID=A0A511XK47_9PROT|nr:AsmA-like C-terminal region-containing protein [Acetobacter oeni]MBB3883128.1 hypothetical protein [Acetobacter oeni]NHO19232.1 hypothetical protein [Acetobacter oeni]GBR07031.1 hypothetical protein AA21952_2210 [Acetobacter oeni LMG 21952]GEN63309.1 hypothetical protein AOE01nite_15330 [Acetobacter oeni]